MEQEKEIQQVKNRLRDLAGRSYSQGIYTFTGFLGLSGQDAFWQIESELRYAGYTLEGGFNGAERVVIRFGSEKQMGYSVPFPIACIHIRPTNSRFADELSHRDFLGALMNVGIDRGTLGDIVVSDSEAYLFCLETVADFVCENLSQVRHTMVLCERTQGACGLPEKDPEPVNIQVQSLRVDAVLSKIYNISRDKSLELFRSGKVFVNGRLCSTPSRMLKAQEPVSVRGFGRFLLSGEPRETRKGKLSVEAKVYR